MKKSEIKVGRYYLIKVNGQIVPVRVDQINTERKPIHGIRLTSMISYEVANLKTGRKVVLYSAAKFRKECTNDGKPISDNDGYKEKDNNCPFVGSPMNLVTATKPSSDVRQDVTSEIDQLNVGSRVIFIGPEYKYGASGLTIGDCGIIIERAGYISQVIGKNRKRWLQSGLTVTRNRLLCPFSAYA